jgi:hypothetical protein
MGRAVPQFSISDLIFLVAYITMAIAVAGVLSGYKKMGLELDWSRSKWVIPVIVAFLLLVAVLVLRPILTSPVATTGDKIFNPAYVLLNFAILAPAAIFAMTLGRGWAGRPYLYAALTLVGLGVADMGFLWLQWNKLYRPGNLIDVLYAACFLTAGLAGACQLSAEREKGPFLLFGLRRSHKAELA